MTQLNYRTKAYFHRLPKPGANTILYCGHTTKSNADEILSFFLAMPFVTGGQIEKYVRDIGWVLETDDEEEVNRRRVDCDPIPPHTVS